MRRVAIGLGTNLGDRRANLRQAVDKMASEFLKEIVASNVYETPPWGILDQPDFLNAVVAGTSDWEPPALVSCLKRIERDMGRVEGPRFGPRLIDLDLIAWGDATWESEGVSVPHPRMAEREFVLLPLGEIWPEWRHPVTEKSVTELLAEWRSTQPSAAKAIAPLL